MSLSNETNNANKNLAPIVLYKKEKHNYVQRKVINREIVIHVKPLFARHIPIN